MNLSKRTLILFSIQVLLFNLSPSISAAEKIQLLVSVDWEGRNLGEDNLSMMRSFRAEFPKLKLLHFLNAAYFTKPNANPELITRKINSTLRLGDELGLHVHGWKTLFETAGVQFREGPTLWGNSISGCEYDCGHEVGINSYSTNELRKVIQFSTEMLNQHGFGRATSFRTGAWLGASNVLDALVAEGFTLDSSAVPVILLQDEIGNSPLFSWIKNLWSSTQVTSQPYSIKTRAGTIWEVPDNGALADYMQAHEMVDVFKKGVALMRSTHQEVYVQIGFHQETAKTYLPRVKRALNMIQELAKKEAIPLEYANLPLLPQ